MNQPTLGLTGGDGFGEAPETVQRTVREMEMIAQRRAGNAKIVAERDTERFLVVVFPTRAERERALAALGLPSDERYLLGEAVELRLREGWSGPEALILGERPAKAAAPELSGAAG